MDLYREYGDIAEEMLGHVENRTTAQAPDHLRVPVAKYLDPAVWRKEKERIFHRLPLMLAMTAEMPQPNDYKAMEVVGKPVLITRGKDGRARAFLNVCKHRAMHMAADGRGNCARFVCQYHGWTYANDGSLVGIAEAGAYGAIDKATLGLTELPCDEAAGLIFVILTPGLPIDARAWLGGMYDDLAALNLADWYYHKSRPMPGANWKIAYDGYLEGYHFQAAHGDTVATRSPSNRAAYRFFGPHMRIGFPQHRITRLRDLPREEWGRQENNGYDFIRVLFPNFSFFIAPEMAQIAQLFPGDTPDSNVTLMNYLSPQKPETDEAMAAFDQMCDFFYNVVEEEDYGLGLKVQSGLESGAMTHITFGRNEPGNQHFHRWLDYYLSDDPGAQPPTG